jgi:hypothetical protein
VAASWCSRRRECGAGGAHPLTSSSQI